MRSLVINSAKTRRPLTVALIRQQLLSHRGVKANHDTVRRALARWGFKWIRVKGTSALTEGHNKPAVVKYRIEYAKWAAETLRHVGKRGSKYKAMAVLDESYVNLHHTRATTWSIDDKDVVHSIGAGRGKLLCIIGAGMYYRERGKVRAKWVPGSFHCWDSGSTGRARGAQKKNGEPADVDDYHGHFNAEKFEKWFEDLCITMKKEKGPTVFIMDGARYHKRRVDNVPTSGSKKTEMLDWLDANGIPYPDKSTKKTLYAIITAYKPDKVRYRTCEIAKKYGHFVKFTPPYHPELQPIEKIWAAIKNPIAADPVLTGGMTELKRRVEEGSDAVGEAVWLGALAKAQAKEDLYKDQVFDEEIADIEAPDPDAGADEADEVLVG